MVWMVGLAGLCVIGAVAIGFVGLYNGLVALDQRVRTAWANIDIGLKQRHDELGKLVAVCEGYKNFERSTLEAVMRARAGYASATSPVAKMASAAEMSRAFQGLLAVAEAYPDLKTSQNFVQLQDRVSALESHIAAQREAYNEAVNTLNVRVRQFPAFLLAPSMGIHPQPLLEISESDKTDVKIRFS